MPTASESNSSPAPAHRWDDPEYEPPRPPSLRPAIMLLVTIGLIGLGILATAGVLAFYPVGVEHPQNDRCGSIAAPIELVDAEGAPPLAERQRACEAALGRALGEASIAATSGTAMLGGSIAVFVWSLRRRARWFAEHGGGAAAGDAADGAPDARLG